MAPRFSFISHVPEVLSHIFQRPKPTPTLGDGNPANDPFAGNFNYSQPFQITINGTNFPCTDWRTIEAPRRLERSYDMGYVGGMGVFAEDAARAPDQFYIAQLLDTTTFPYVRLPKYVAAKIDVTNMSGANPCYAFTEEDSGGAEYTYILTGDNIAKVKLSDNSLANAIRDADIDADGSPPTIGRPVLFEGKWHVPCGGLVDWIRLDTVATGASADTWNTASTLTATASGRRAYHFALHMQEGTAQIAGAFNVAGDADPDAGVECNLIALSADAITWGTGFEVGDTSLAITHMESIGGELFIAKPDSPWRVSEDGGGNAYPVMDFVGKAQKLSGYTGEDGALSGSWGSFGYFTHSSGIWRIAGDHATPIDPQADPRWTGISLDGLIPSFLGRWGSVATYGRWMYACSDTNLFHGYLLEDGSVRWAGIMFDNGFVIRAMIAPDSTNPILWILDSNNDLHRVNLNEDGSTREITTPGTLRGAYGTSANPTVATAQIWMPETDFGVPGVAKQLRMGWFDMDDFTDTGVTVSVRAHRDRLVTSTLIGAASGSGQNGLHEVSQAKAAVIVSSSVASPSVITTLEAHGFTTGDLVTIQGHTSTPDVDGDHIISSASGSTFTIPINVTVGGTGGRVRNDTFRRLIPALRFVTDGNYVPANSDPRCREWGIRAVTQQVVQATITLDDPAMLGYGLSVRDALRALRDLKSGVSIAVREPGLNTTFTGHITDVQETATVGNNGAVTYGVVLTISRWVI